MLTPAPRYAACIALLGFALAASARPAPADPLATLRIEAALAAVGQAPGFDAAASDIVSLERDDSQGPSLAVTLHPGFDQAMADLTTNRAGQRLIISVCGRIVLEPLLTEPISTASILITTDDPARLDAIEAALRSPSCDAAPIG
jgi:hypothetical protein